MRGFLSVLFSVSIIALSLNALALEVRVVGAQGVLLFSEHIKTPSLTHVGDVTLEMFERFEVPFTGGSYGFSKIFNLENDMQIISDSEMKAYGWCFSVDGLTPETMADQTPIKGSERVIEWYYAYAHYKDGSWISQCER